MLLEKGEALINCLAYIDLNPVRARMVERPEDYRWSGIGYRIYETYRHELMRDFKLPAGEIMLGSIRYFSYGLVIGSKQFLKDAYAQFGGEIIVKKDRKVYQTGINRNILSLRKLIC